MAPSRWTSFLGGGSKDSESSQPLVPDSNPQQDSYSQYLNASAPPLDPGAQSGAGSDPDFPEPVKPGSSQQHAYAQHAPQPGHQEYSAPPPVYQQSSVADGYPVLPHATQPPIYDAPPLVVNRELLVVEPLRGASVVVTCPRCGHTGPAAVFKESGFVAFFSSFMLCFLGCCILSLFPFCCDSCKDWVYRCRRCGTLFGRERP